MKWEFSSVVTRLESSMLGERGILLGLAIFHLAIHQRMLSCFSTGFR